MSDRAANISNYPLLFNRLEVFHLEVFQRQNVDLSRACRTWVVPKPLAVVLEQSIAAASNVILLFTHNESKTIFGLAQCRNVRNTATARTFYGVHGKEITNGVYIYIDWFFMPDQNYELQVECRNKFARFFTLENGEALNRSDASEFLEFAYSKSQNCEELDFEEDLLAANPLLAIYPIDLTSMVS